MKSNTALLTNAEVSQLPGSVVVFVDRSEPTVTSAAASVLSTLLDINKIAIQNEPLGKPIKLPQHSALLLSQAQIGNLAGLRLGGFSGAVLILSFDSFDALKEKYRILRWGQGSHDACQFPWTLPALVEKLTKLVPLEPENLEMLQNELKAPARWFQRRVVPCLKRLQKSEGNSDELDTLAAIVTEVRAHTPVTCHAVVVVEGHSAQIQQHFQILLNQMRLSPRDNETNIKLLRQVFEQWRDLVLNAGEGMGAFI